MNTEFKSRQPENHALIIFVKFSVLFFIALLGWLNLNQIFNGDQAMFTVYAAEMNKGALLYRDVWDIKQPGIFIFYLAGGKFFGFTERGIHLFELIYWLVFSLVLQSTLKNYFRSRLFAQIAPLLTIGIYYAVCRNWHMTQVEALAGFPLYLTLWAAVEAFRSAAKRKQFGFSVLSGFSGGAVLMLKLAFLPLVLIFWLLLLSFLVKRKNNSPGEAFGSTGATGILLGAIVLPLAVFIYFAQHDALAIVFYTFFEYPSQAILELTADDRSEVLKESFSWFVLSFKSLMLVAAISGFLRLRRRDSGLPPPPSSRRLAALAKINLMNAGLIAWLVAGVGVILFQRLSWWEYHWFLLLVPCGILAAKGVEIIWQEATEAGSFGKFFTKTGGKIVVFCSIIVLFSPYFKQITRKADGSFENYIKTPNGQAVVATATPPSGDYAEKYLTIRDEVGFLPTEKITGSPEKIFVVGQPLYYYFSGRAPAISSNGWMPEFFLDKQWRQLEAELRETKPKYIFIEVNLYGHLIEKSPETIKFLSDYYRLRKREKVADCYELNSAEP